MLLVHDDQADVRQRREDRATRADDDVHVAAADAVPLVVALAVGESAVLDGDALAECGAEDRGGRRRQGDLGDHQQHAAPGLADLARQPKIDLRLATARDAVQQRDVVLRRRGAGRQDVEPRPAARR